MPRVYLLPDGRHVPVTQRHSWCETCNDISPIECLTREQRHLDFVRDKLQELRKLELLKPEEVAELSPGRRFRAERATIYISNLLQVEKDWQDWRHLRTEPEKCLRCGTRDGYVPDQEWQDLFHLGCGGVLICTAEISSSCEATIYPHVYSVDGVLLERGRKPVISEVDITYVPMELFCSP